jgi:fucose 4-O-acetylase-like acetyltransferase
MIQQGLTSSVWSDTLIDSCQGDLFFLILIRHVVFVVQVQGSDSLSSQLQVMAAIRYILIFFSFLPCYLGRRIQLSVVVRWQTSWLA